ncbi:MAG: bifunctional (p)ppGpp synthetase/guanosine-3',5'-bis(diphosphate) 3'-pyrophosphohydrolase [Clostridia bacterium]|nr:bifunctional (p)ppGpp synthetase/guanosine-3',5'-bis(diphosphate) 3'-pyrophosphohydrolase [Oscillospiraceae bacterium]MBR6748516.1 bifunctional (p)ppGpp synthetase/guanosine-3',5'-bis(diphosphate) 3'-pyrophosphohydrolase [Clostridia bacterium]
MARDAHDGQKRKNGEPFIIHPLAVAEMLAEMGMDPESIMAGLMHDVIEDTSVSYDEMKAQFGTAVANLVDGVTKLTRMPHSTYEEEENENLRKLFMAMARDIRVIIIKLNDRLHNLRTLQYVTERKQKEKALETMLIYAPIAHRLGMNNVKSELEDISLRYLDPVAYQEISNYLENSAEERSAFLNIIIKRIEDRLTVENIKGEVQGRVKHFYGIYRKVYMQNKDISSVFDIYAVRIIVDSLADCYNALGIVHDLFKPMPGRFKDYISTPKPNLYQSLHSTVIGREGKPFEVQIRTRDMHNTAEYGVAAHWKYKHGVSRQSDESKYAWVRQLLENQQDSDPEDFINSLRTELFNDEVYVFTPKGDVINLPAGATPIDFAYAIHSAVGNRMTGAKVNGRIVQLDHALSNGDIVEVLTSGASKGPSRDWLKVVKTNEARNKIRMWFKKERREENIEQGKAALEAELKRTMLMQAFADPTIQATICTRLSFHSVDDLYAAIGYGALPVRKVMTRVTELAPKPEKNVTPVTKVIKTKPSNGVIVEGVDNCLVKFARCCTPIPGDEIIGFITKGFGVSVHRADCPNVQALMTAENEGRVMRVSWVESGKESYQTMLHIRGKNRRALLADVTMALSDMRIDLTGLTARELDDGGAEINAMVMLHDAEQLGQVALRLKNIPGVSEVERTIR